MINMDKAYKAGIILIIIIIAAGIISLFLPKFRSNRELQRRKSALEQENKYIEQETKKIHLKREKFKTDPEFVERVARKSGRVKPDEVIFRFTTSQDNVTGSE